MIFKISNNIILSVKKITLSDNQLLPYYLEVFKDNEQVHQEWIYGGKYYLKHYINFWYDYYKYDLDNAIEEEENQENECISLFDFINGYE